MPAQDVHEKATLLLRQTATEQKGAIDPTLVVALHVRQRPTYKAFNREYARLALRSGSEIAVPLADLRDPKVAVLETLRYESS